MDKERVRTVLRLFAEALERRGVHAHAVVLFGSQAKGSTHEWSDIDAVVISSDFTGKSVVDRLRVLGRAISEVWEPIEAMGFTPDEWERGDSNIAQFALDGEIVYRGGGHFGDEQ